jgi:hypothetical protein
VTCKAIDGHGDLGVSLSDSDCSEREGILSNVVFVLGAGCSVPCGGPTMAQFLDVARRLYETKAVPERASDYERVFKAIGCLTQVHSKSQLDINNIESVFTALELASTLKKLPGFDAEEIPGVVQSLKALIVTTLERKIEFPFRGTSVEAPGDYGRFVELVKHIMVDANPRRSVAVITFNYDIAVDVSFWRSGMDVDYSLEDNDKGVVPLLKLHGSLNWASRTTDNHTIALSIREYFSKHSFQSFETVGKTFIPIGTQLHDAFLQQESKIETLREPVIVPPTWNKAEYQRDLSRVWARAAKELSDAEHLFIIGYSLPETDQFFRFLYALGTAGNVPFTRIEVHNPDASGEVEKRFRSLLGPGALARFVYNQLPFGPSIGHIRDHFPGRSR